MDLSVLHTVSALTVFVSCFRPLVRRAGPHTNIWFIGWSVLLVHYVFLLLDTGKESFVDTIRILIATTAVQACAFCFIIACSNERLSRTTQMIYAEIAVPVFLQSLSYFFEVKRFPVALLIDLLFVVPAVHLLCIPRHRSRCLNPLAIAFALLGVGLAPFSRIDPYTTLNLILCVLFLCAAYLTFISAARLSRGVGIMTSGLTLWGLSYLLQANGWLESNVHLNHAVLDLPRFLVAAGMILLLLDEYVNRTENLALHDPLTGLPNRRLFQNRLDQAIEESAVTHTPIACLVIDVDNFKYINDNFGHPVGDGLLQALAKRLSWNLGPRDMLARTGGDEFTAILVEAADEYHIRFIAGAMMAAGCVPVSIQQHAIDVRISIGIAVSPQDADGSSDLHKAADDAMYQAKRRGGSVIAFANEEIPQIHAV